MNSSFKALCLTDVADIKIGETYTPLHVDNDGNIVRKDDHYPPYWVKYVDAGRKKVVVHYGNINGEEMKIDFVDFGLEGEGRCFMQTDFYLDHVMDAILGPRPLPRLVDVRDQNPKARISGNNLLVASA